MKRLLGCLILTCLLAGCYGEESDTLSPSEYARLRDSQFRHYRPIHWQHRDWIAAESGRTLTLTADGIHIRLSARHNPDRVVIRENGVIIGSVEKSEDGAVFVPASGVSSTSSLFCLESPKLKLKSGDHTLALVFDERSASSEKLQVNGIQRHKYSVSEKTVADNNDICSGSEVESPFSAAGTLMLQDDDIELPARLGFAWFVTRFDTKCRRDVR